MSWPSGRVRLQLVGALVLVLIAASAIALRAYGMRTTTTSALTHRSSATQAVTPSASENGFGLTPSATPGAGMGGGGPQPTVSAAPEPTSSVLSLSDLPAGWVPHANDAVVAYDEAHGYPLMLTLEFPPPPPGSGVMGSHWVTATWKWDGSRWLLLHPAGSPPNLGSPDGNTWSNLVYDAALHKVVVVARSGAPSGSGAVGTVTTWGWDGVNWADLQMTPMPSADAAHNYLSFDQAHVQLVLLQSTSYAGTTQTWTSDGTTWTHRSPPTQPTGPPLEGGVAYDPRSTSVLVFGGTNGMGSTNLNETWTWDGTTWKHLQPAARPAGGSTTVAYDAEKRQMVLFEAAFSTPGAGTRTTSTWTWDGTTWSSVPVGGGPAFGGEMTYDPVRRELIMAGRSGEMYGAVETWAYARGQWSRVP